jgi:thiol reductant ABC exporter CydC subunit
MTTFTRLVKLTAPYRGWFFLAVFLGFLQAGSGVGLTATSAYLIARAALHPSIAELSIAIVGVRFFGVARGLLRYAERMTTHAATFRLLTRLRVWFYQALEPLAPAGLQQRRSGDLLARAVGDIEQLEQIYARVLAPPLVALLTALLISVILLSIAPITAALTIGLLLLAGLVLPLIGLRLGRAPGRKIVGLRAALSTRTVDGLQGMADLIALGQAERYQAELQQIERELHRAQEQMAIIRGIGAGLSALLAGLSAVGVIVLAAPLVGAGTIDGVLLALLALSALASFDAVAPLPAALQQMEQSLASARRIFELIDQPAPVAPRPHSSVLPAARTPRSETGFEQTVHASIEVRNLTLAYGHSAPALDGISFDLSPGARVALVGPSGAGKSSVARALLRFWEYQGGTIRLGGHDLRSYDPECLRESFAVVDQQTHLFAGSIRDNLLLADPQADDIALEQVSRLADLDPLINSLPAGLDTWIGELGLHLSSGERQRLAIARALLKDAPILILDEPTAHLDSDNERAVG